jgi:hypothetical protein
MRQLTAAEVADEAINMFLEELERRGWQFDASQIIDIGVAHGATVREVEEAAFVTEADLS